MPAPLGFLDYGAAKAKTLDPKTAPLVRQAFELYASRRFSLRALGPELHRRGLRRPDGKPYPRTRLSKLLNNPFYSGLIRIKKTGEYFAGIHEPLVSRAVFERVQAVMAGKTNTAVKKYDFLYRRRLTCKGCQYSLIGELQKGHTYYRCHTEVCPTACVREDAVETAVFREFFRIQLTADERRYLQQELERMKDNATGHREETVAALKLRLAQTEDRIARLTDAFIDRLIEQDLFEVRKKTLLSERIDLETQIANWQAGKVDTAGDLAKFIERADTACLAYKAGTVEEKRDLLDTVTSNRLIDGKTPVIVLSLPFRAIAERPKSVDGAPSNAIHRVWKPLLSRLANILCPDMPT
jgi:hypothetical protein